MPHRLRRVAESNRPSRGTRVSVERSPLTVAKGLSFSREYDVRRGRRRHMLGARIAQRRQVHPRKERLTTAEQDRRDRDMHLVDEPRLEILAHRGRPAADLDIAPARGLPGATPSTPWRPGVPPESTAEVAGSRATIYVAGFARRKTREVPISMPDVPTAAQNA